MGFTSHVDLLLGRPTGGDKAAGSRAEALIKHATVVFRHAGAEVGNARFLEVGGAAARGFTRRWPSRYAGSPTPPRWSVQEAAGSAERRTSRGAARVIGRGGLRKGAAHRCAGREWPGYT
jgi:hypothetical protein